MKRYITLIILLFTDWSLYAQNYKVLSTHTVYAEAGGASGLYSLNYDKIFNWPGKKLKMDIELGGAYLRKPYSYYNIHTGTTENALNKDKILTFRTALLLCRSPFLYGIGLTFLHDEALFTYDYSGYSGYYWMAGNTIVPYLQIRYLPQMGGLFCAFNLNVTLRHGVFYAVEKYVSSSTLDGYSKFTGQYVWPGLCIGYTFKGRQAKQLKNGT